MKSQAKVIVTDFLRPDQLELERGIIGDLAEVQALDAYHEDELVGRIDEADALIVYHNVSLTRRSIELLSRCKVIVRGGVGFDNIDHRCARRHGIAVANVPDYGTEEVADSAIGMLLTMTRGIHLLNSRLRHGGESWTHTLAAPLLRLRGRVLGIVGLGRIGTATALRAKALGMEVLYFDPYRDDGYDKALGVRRVETLGELFPRAFVVSLHCPLHEETYHLINAQSLAQFQPGSYLVNTARGAIVDTSAIPDAIATGHLAGAGIDVLEQEPPPDDDPLLVAWRDPGHPAHDRVVMTPHAAFYCEQGFTDLRSKAALTCRKALRGEPLRNVVNAP
jgi:D-3-phosphoglycerate dehydrogenase/C-terminal binding protein